MRSVRIEPFDVQIEFQHHVLGSERNANAASAFVLERSDEAFDHGDTAVSSDGTESRLDLSAFTPFEVRMILSVLRSGTSREELGALVGDDVLGFGLLANRFVENPVNLV